MLNRGAHFVEHGGNVVEGPVVNRQVLLDRAYLLRDATHSPVKTGQPPINSVEVTIDTSQPPIAPLQTLIDTTEVAIDAGQPPIALLETLIDATEVPIDGCQVFIAPLQTSIDTTEVTVDAGQPPIAPLQTFINTIQLRKDLPHLSICHASLLRFRDDDTIVLVEGRGKGRARVNAEHRGEKWWSDIADTATHGIVVRRIRIAGEPAKQQVSWAALGAGVR
jgi:hypothetical protein